MASHSCKPSCVNWVGTNKCHCASCGETFSYVTTFDLHRVKEKCVAPSSIGLRRNRYGVWVAEGEVDYSERFGGGL